MSGLTLFNPTQSPEEPDDSPTGAALLDQVAHLISWSHGKPILASTLLVEIPQQPTL